MTRYIEHLLPGEELTDPESFFALHSTQPTVPEAGVPAPAAPPSARSVPREPREGSGRPLTRPVAPALSGACRPRESSGKVLCSPASPAAVATLEAEIDRCASREHVVRLAVHLAHTYATATALFVVYQGLIERVWSEGLPGRGEGLLFPADAPSLFAEVVTSGQLFRGVPPQGVLDRRIQRALGRQHVREMALFPVAIRGRVVNLLYADNGPETLGDASVAALAAVCVRLSRAYERLILERKKPGLAGVPHSSRQFRERR